jgi:hypothetical protein
MHQNWRHGKRCFDVTNALLAASAQLNAVSAVSGLAILEKPISKAAIEIHGAQELRNVLDASGRSLILG